MESTQRRLCLKDTNDRTKIMKSESMLAVVTLTVTALFLSGCGKASEKTAEKLTEKAMEKSMRQSGAKDAKVDIENGKFKMATSDGEVVVDSGDSVSLPADFPKDVHLIKGAKIQMAMKVPQGQMIQLQLSQSMSQVVSVYDTEMKAQGWTQEASMAMGEAHSAAYRKDKRLVSLMISKTEDGSAAVITVTQDEE